MTNEDFEAFLVDEMSKLVTIIIYTTMRICGKYEELKEDD